MKGPGLFSDIGKKGRDLLFKDYTSEQKLSFSTSTATGLGLTSSTVKKGGLCVSDVTTQYKYKNATLNVKADTDSNISTTVTLEELRPFTKAIATFKFPDYNSGKLEVQYFHDHAGIAGVVALKQSPTVDLSGTLGTHGIIFGAGACFDTSSGSFTKYGAGISMTKPEYIVSLLLEDKGDTLKASYVQQLNENQKTAAVAEFSRKLSTNENSYAIGGLYELDPFTTVKTRVNNSGNLGALLQHHIKPNNILTVSGEIDTRALEKRPRFGLALALKP